LKDFVNKFIVGTIQLGYYPTEREDVVFDMAPADWVSSAIVRIGQSPESVGNAYHLFNGVAPAASTLASIARSANSYPTRSWAELKPLPFKEWKTILDGTCRGQGEGESMTNVENALTPILSYFSGSRFPRGRIFDCAKTFRMLDHLSHDDNLLLRLAPAITEDILHRYILFYQRNGLLQ